MLYLLANFFFYIYDLVFDLIYCGFHLQQNVNCVDAFSGYTSSQSCRYIILRSIFKKMTLNSEYNFLDVGCGQGRVLAFLLRKKTRWKLTGIELNDRALKICRRWSDGTEVKIIEMDVFNYDISNYDIFFLGHPFDSSHLLQFIKRIESEVKQKVLVIIVLDINMGSTISKRSRWSIIQQELIDKYYFLPILPKKNRFTIYSYSPVNYGNNKTSI